MQRTLWIALLAAYLCPAATSAPSANAFRVLRYQKIVLKGDSITRGYAFGNYTDPSPLRTIPGIASILLQDNLAHPPGFLAAPNIWKGLNADGSPKTVDTLAAELNGNIKSGDLTAGYWLI